MEREKNYTKEQEAVIASPMERSAGASLLLAGPGSGKTFTIVERLRYLLEHGAEPKEVLLVTFARAAAGQMRQRFLKNCGGIRHPEDVTFGTMHSIFYSILQEEMLHGKSSGSVLTQGEKMKILLEVIRQFNYEGAGFPEEAVAMEEMLEEIATYKNRKALLVPATGNGTAAEQIAESIYCDSETFADFADCYIAECRAREKMDFDDMIILLYEFFCRKPAVLEKWQKVYRYILVDEAQDTGMVQLEVIRMLGAKSNLLFVGDDDQSMYRFRGAEPGWMKEFSERFEGGRVYLLTQNFRCAGEVVEKANRLIAHNRERCEKEAVARRGVRGNVALRQYDNTTGQYEAMANDILNRISAAFQCGKCPGEYAVLVRTNSQIPAILCALEREKGKRGEILKGKVQIDGGEQRIESPYEHWAVQDLECYFKCALGKGDEEDWIRILERPGRGVSRGLFAIATDYTGKENIPIGVLDVILENRTRKITPETVREVRKMKNDLEMLGNLRPFAAVSFVRRGMSYENGFAVLKEEKIGALLNEIQDEARNLRTLEEWMEMVHKNVETVRRENEKRKKPEARQDKDTAKIFIMTYHGAKGLEFDAVYLPDAVEGITPYNRARTAQQLEEERRMFYVAMTRAKDYLTICVPKVNSRNMTGCRISRFVQETGLSSFDPVK